MTLSQQSQPARALPVEVGWDDDREARFLFRETAFQVARRLGAYDSDDLLIYARGLQEHAGLDRGGLLDRLQVALPLALVRPLRQLAVTGHGPRCVHALPFDKVLTAADMCADLYVPGRAGFEYPAERAQRRDGSRSGEPAQFGVRTLREWIDRHGLRPWLVDASLWRRLVDFVQHAAAPVGASSAVAQLAGHRVEWAEARSISVGPRDGAPGLELIFDDGQAVSAPVTEQADGAVFVGLRLLREEVRGTRHSFVFSDSDSRTATLALADSSGVVVQPSPHDTPGRPAVTPSATLLHIPERRAA